MPRKKNLGMRGSRTGKRSWEIISEFSARGDGDKAVTEAVLNLAIDAVDAPADPAQLLRALRIAQSALRGEKARGEAAEERARMGGDLSAAPAQDIAQLTEKLRIVEDELAEIREERDELTEDLAALERKDRQGGRRSMGAGSSTAQDQRTKIEELEGETRDLRIKNKDLVREAGRKDEIINARSQTLEELRTAMNSERDERRQLEEDVRVMRSQIRDYQAKLENTNDSVMAREERNREGNKQLRQKTREINQLLAENASLRRDLKDRDDDLQELAVNLEQEKTEKADVKTELEESTKLVNSLERQISAAETTEQALNKKIEELQAEMDDDEEENEKEKAE